MNLLISTPWQRGRYTATDGAHRSRNDSDLWTRMQTTQAVVSFMQVNPGRHAQSTTADKVGTK